MPENKPRPTNPTNKWIVAHDECDCPTCEAKAGEDCRLVNIGKPEKTMIACHHARYELAAKMQSEAL